MSRNYQNTPAFVEEGNQHAERAAAARSASYAWLIEAPGTHYLGARTLGVHEFFWTTDHTKALRFYSQEQADQTMMAVYELKPELFAFAKTLSEARTVQHSWIDQ